MAPFYLLPNSRNAHLGSLCLGLEAAPLALAFSETQRGRRFEPTIARSSWSASQHFGLSAQKLSVGDSAFAVSCPVGERYSGSSIKIKVLELIIKHLEER